MRPSTSIVLALCLLAGCEQTAAPFDDGGGDAARPDAASTTQTLSLSDIPADGGPLVVDEVLEVGASGLVVDLTDIADGALVSIEIEADGIEGDVEGWEVTESGPAAAWWRSRPVGGPTLTVYLSTASATRARLRVVARHAPADTTPPRSLAWTDEAIVDDPEVVGLSRVMTPAADGHGGALLDEWLRTFARTAHSERPALADFADHLRSIHGDDPASWSLDALPFRVTAVHNRLDLRNDVHCGELRVSLNVTDSLYPFIHFLFLFAQEPTDLDRSFTGTLHCEDTAFRWARLTTPAETAFFAEARALLDRALTAPNFLLAESLERTVGTWEWRQWTPEAGALSNPPLFQTVDVERLNTAGADRDALLSWIEAEADAIAARRAPIPTHFAPRSARATEGVPRPELSLEGLDPAVDAEAVALALDTVGCPGCHARSPTFLQTNADRSFSPFYDDELAARARALDSFRTGQPAEIPFGALSD